MKLTKEQLFELSQLALSAAKEAATYIAEASQKEIKTEIKSSGKSLASQVVTEVDRKSQDMIIERLKPAMEQYDLGLLTEESEDDHSRLHQDYFWCIDPLDGTLAFTRKKEGYAVSIALVSRAGESQLGVVVNPVDQAAYCAVVGQGAWKNGQKVTLSDFDASDTTFTFVADPSFYDYELREPILERFNTKIKQWGYDHMRLIDQGGAAMNAIWVLNNAPACYFKLPKKTQGGGSLWDYAATTCIYNELGAVVSDMSNRPLHLNRPDTVFMNDVGVLFCTDQITSKFIRELHQLLQNS